MVAPDARTVRILCPKFCASLSTVLNSRRVLEVDAFQKIPWAILLLFGGGFALEQGFLYSAMIWSAMVVYIVDREFRRAAFWSFSGALLSILGLMHSYQLTGSDSIINLPIFQVFSGNSPDLITLFPAWEYAVGYGLVGLILLVTPLISRPETTPN